MTTLQTIHQTLRRFRDESLISDGWQPNSVPGRYVLDDGTDVTDVVADLISDGLVKQFRLRSTSRVLTATGAYLLGALDVSLPSAISEHH